MFVEGELVQGVRQKPIKASFHQNKCIWSIPVNSALKNQGWSLMSFSSVISS